jgi:hypothetical protein
LAALRLSRAASAILSAGRTHHASLAAIAARGIVLPGTRDRAARCAGRARHPGRGYSRDKRPDPRVDASHPYRPVNGPAIGNLMSLFDL